MAAVDGFKKRYALENEVNVNIEQSLAILVGHSLEHELATTDALGISGSIDNN